MTMEDDGRAFLQGARLAGEQAKASTDPKMRADWKEIADNYRELARHVHALSARLSVLKGGNRNAVGAIIPGHKS